MKDNRIFTENNTNRVYTVQELKRELLADCRRLSPAQQDKLEEFEKIKTRDKYIQVMLDGIDTLVTLSPQTLTRLLYLSTYIQYNSGLLVVDNQTLTKGQVCHLLHINHTTAGSFLDELTQAGVLSVDAARLEKKTQCVYIRLRIAAYTRIRLQLNTCIQAIYCALCP